MEATGTDPLTGLVLDGRYRIDGILGRGGMGAVYRATQIGAIERDVAVKVMRDVLPADDVRARRFQHEIKIIARLRHPNTVRLVDAGTLPDGRPYVVTELLEGRPLDEIIRQGPLEPRRAFILASQICEALSEAHSLGIVHRDLKPGNVFVQNVAGTEIAKVLDFGLARDEALPTLTNPAQTFGTPAYMSPEQCQGSRIGPPGDIYALGAILYECLSGEQVFKVEDGNPLAVMIMHLSEDPLPLHERPNSQAVPAPAEDLVMQMLAKSPDERPASAMAVHAQLLALLAEPSAQNPSFAAAPWKGVLEDLVADMAEESTEDRSGGASQKQVKRVSASNDAAPIVEFPEAEDTQREGEVGAFNTDKAPIPDTKITPKPESLDSIGFDAEISETRTVGDGPDEETTVTFEDSQGTDPSHPDPNHPDINPVIVPMAPGKLRPPPTFGMGLHSDPRGPFLPSGPGYRPGSFPGQGPTPIPFMQAPPEPPKERNQAQIAILVVLVLCLIVAAFLLGGAVMNRPHP